MTDTIFLPDEKATVAFGKTLAKACKGKGLITLSGNLGTGKTTLSRGIIQAFGHTGAVKSPTYTLVEPYELGDIRIYHFDLYRLEDPEELEFIGLWDYLNEDALVLLEWPERAGSLLPPADMALHLMVRDTGRDMDWKANTPRGEQIIGKLRVGDTNKIVKLRVGDTNKIVK
jgi:tRNA threonylcarbamoyladenosine biosynthesis protein TsaE